MRRFVMSIFDVKQNGFGQPFFVVSRGIAFRSIGDDLMRKDTDNVMARHPGDFKLYELGEFEDSTGMLKVHAKPEFVIEVQTLMTE